MSDKADAPQPSMKPTDRPVLAAVLARMRGPGGLYNLGNIIGLSSGIFFALWSAPRGETSGSFDALIAHLIGNPGNAALTIAMLLFIWSGEYYHKAAHAPAAMLDYTLRRADMLSGIAAIFLSVSLVSSGNVMLALASSVLLAGGKFGSAVYSKKGWPVMVATTWPGTTTRWRSQADVFRFAVILSRVPAVAALTVAIIGGVGHPVLTSGVLEATILLLCYVLWTKADLLLTRT